MTDAELRKIEEELGFGLPGFYRVTMLNYPFSGSSQTEHMLPDDPQEVIDLNTGGLEMAGVDNPFFVGCDGERYFFIDADEPLTPVYTSEVETRHHRIQAASWSKYLGQIRRARKERGLEVAKAGAGTSRWRPF